MNDYDSFAEAYAAENDANLYNAYYERPAMLELAGEVSARRILDAGCGSGALTAMLRDRGAHVTGIDASTRMLNLARQRLGVDSDLRVADLADPLPFTDDSFDDVIASLVFHYLEDWGPTLTEIRRVLKPKGRLLISVDHPFVAYGFQRQAGHAPNYFETYRWNFEWTLAGESVPMSFWARPLHAMTDAFDTAGFHIRAIVEPQPVPAARELFPEQYDALTTNPSFLFFALRTD
ncbi:class I SAM-dependent methyltransferase [Nocardia pseudobrasiliensis]|uniref:Methyltransferase family protein n=1 Tax=Nocardia pseudobrasiliensis TaxID=45979 RepID=A0A370HPU6_9NOCA|nr:class I SAM-dependent methyltransferase [Nocardia pseudobrasiliensis]RDI60596.1 methyltransferase family protein [Nocardia pseudobrasiliensis]